MTSRGGDRGGFRGRGGGEGYRGRGRSAPRGDRGGGGRGDFTNRGRGGGADRGGFDRGGYRGGGRGGGGDRGGGGGFRGGGRGGRGGRGQPEVGPVIHKENQVPPPSQEVVNMENQLVKSDDRTTKLTELFQDLSLEAKKNLASLNHPVRPGYGTKGQPVTLWTNHFPIKRDDQITLYQYVLDVKKLSKDDEEEDKKRRSASGRPTRPGGINGKKKRRLIILYIEEGPIAELKDAVATDFDTILITRERLTNKQMAAYSFAYRNDLEDTPPPRPQMYSVTLSGPATLPMQDLGNYLRSANSRYGSEAYGAYKQALEIILGYRAKAERDDITSTIGRKHHDVENSRIENRYLGNAIEAVRGYMASVRFSAGGLLLNVQIKHAACYSRDLRSDDKSRMLLSDSMNESRLINWSDESNINWLAVSRFYKGVQIEVTHLGENKYKGEPVPRLKRILGIAMKADEREATDGKIRITENGAGPSGVFFKQDDGTETSVAAFFKKTYTMTLSESFPLVKVGTHKKPSYLPPEVCRIIPGQPRISRLTDDQTTEMLTYAARKPALNAESILSKSPGVLKLQQANPTLRNFGLTPDTSDLLTVQGRILPAPVLLYGNNKTQTPTDGSWNLRGTKVVLPGRFRRANNDTSAKWGVLMIHGQDLRGHDLYDREPEPDDGNLMRVFNWFSGVLNRDLGVQAGEPLQKPYRCNMAGNRQRFKVNFEACLKQAVRDGMQLLMVILPKKNTDNYTQVKQSGDVAVGLQTMVVTWEKITKPDNRGGPDAMTATNIALKFNLKLNGANNYLGNGALGIIEQGNTMLVGLDVTHPSPGSATRAPSVAALVSSIDKRCQQFPASLHIQINERQEVVDSEPLAKMFCSALEKWWSHNTSKAPQNVIVYRDGVSEGQYDQVLQRELSAMKHGFHMFKGKMKLAKADLKFSLIVCGKRHNTRFYPTSLDKRHTNERTGNPVPGTLVDRYVTDPRDWDFYLQAHAAIKGTAKPCHYVVLHDEIFDSINPNERSDALITLTHNLCYSYGRATKAVSYAPPAYYADRACERARLYLSNYFNAREDDSSETSNIAAMSPEELYAEYTRLTTIATALVNTMNYV